MTMEILLIQNGRALLLENVDSLVFLYKDI